MATYVMLTRYTRQGTEDVTEIPRNLDEVEADAFESVGAVKKEVYRTLGHYDHVVIVEAPDDETMAKVQLKLYERGNVRPEVMRAFDKEEYLAILEDLQ